MLITVSSVNVRIHVVGSGSGSFSFSRSGPSRSSVTVSSVKVYYGHFRPLGVSLIPQVKKVKRLLLRFYDLRRL